MVYIVLKSHKTVHLIYIFSPAVYYNPFFVVLSFSPDAKADLDRAILLSDRSEEEAEGHNHNRNELIVVARQAYCQRALIHLLRENKEQGNI